MPWTARVVKVHGEAPELVGQTRVLADGLVVGRGDTADWVLADSRVSRAHARFDARADGWAVLPLARGTVFVNGEPAERATALRDLDLVQLGPVLLRVFANAETDPYRGPVLGTRSQPLLRLSMGEHRAWLGSTPLDLRPAAFRTLAALARRPGAWVERDVLAEAIWGDDLHFGNPAYVDKYLSQVRTALRDALAATDAGDPIHAALDALRDPTEADPVRALLETRRGVGNRLGLEPDQVAVDEGAS